MILIQALTAVADFSKRSESARSLVHLYLQSRCVVDSWHGRACVRKTSEELGWRWKVLIPRLRARERPRFCAERVELLSKLKLFPSCWFHRCHGDSGCIWTCAPRALAFVMFRSAPSVRCRILFLFLGVRAWIYQVEIIVKLRVVILFSENESLGDVHAACTILPHHTVHPLVFGHPAVSRPFLDGFA